jgi:uncharacterized membrane protein YfcA
MPVDILLTVVLTTLIQSVFGVGVLLFGTPVLLLLGHDFVNALLVLLPISIAINSLQLLKHYRYVDIGFYKNVLIYSIPFVVLFLWIITSVKINISALVGGLLILVALKNISPVVDKALRPLFNYERTYLAIMGVIHGMTNLGGSLLTAIVYGKPYQKDQTRATVASCYATFALFQLAVLFFISHEFDVSYADNIGFLQVGVVTFLLAEEMLYSKIDNKKYNMLFAGFLLASGILLLVKSL